MDTDIKQDEHRFERQSEYKFGAVTYQVTAHFDDDSEDVIPKVKQLLQNALQIELSQTRQPMK